MSIKSIVVDFKYLGKLCMTHSMPGNLTQYSGIKKDLSYVIQPFSINRLCNTNTKKEKQTRVYNISIQQVISIEIQILTKLYYNSFVVFFFLLNYKSLKMTVQSVLQKSEASRGAAARGVTVKPTGCGFDPHSRR